MKNKKLIGEILFLLLVFGVTVYMVFRGEDLHQTLAVIAQVRKLWLAPAALCVVFFIWGESIIIYYMMATLHVRLKKWTCFLFSSIGFFYSCITPSASGGQPMQVLYMRRDGIPAGVSTVVLAIVTITYKMVLVLIGLAVMLLRPPAVMACLQGVEGVIYLGMALNVVAISLLLMAVFLPGPLEKCVEWVLRIIQKIRPFRNPQKVAQRVNGSLSQYRGTASFFKKEPLVILVVFLITFVQRFCLFSVVWFTYRAFGLTGQNPVTVSLLYGMISVAVDMLPLPGGMGISETLFSSIFLPIFGAELVLPGMILCRGISYYTQLLISAIMTMAAHLVFRKKDSK